MPERPEPPDRLEREIEEILDKIERFPGPEARRTRKRQRSLHRVGGRIADAQQAVMRELSRVSMSQVMLLSFLMILGSFFFRRFNPLLTQWMLYAGIVLFISSFAILMFSRGSRGGGATQTTRWRGRTVEYRARRPGTAQRLRRWWAGRKTRR